MILKRSRAEHKSPLRGLDRLLNQLNFDGIPIGLEEILRLHHAFSLQPPSDRDTLFNLLACCLCKSPQQKRLLADDFDLWFEDAQEVLRPPEQPGPRDEPGKHPPDQSTGIESSTDPKHQAKPKIRQAESRGNPKSKQFRIQIARTLGPLPWWIYLCLFCVLLTGIVLWIFYSEPDPTLPTPPDTSIINPIPPPPIPQAPDEFAPAPEYWTWRPEVRVVADSESRSKLEALIFLIPLTLIAVLAAGLRFYLRKLGPKAETPSRKGPGWTPLLPQFGAAANLVSAAERSAAVWNIDKFISEDLTRTLDIRRTVDHTCREAGIPVLRYRLAQYPREIWLWRDMEAETSTADRLITELTTAFQRFGLPVRAGRFWGTPELLEWEEGYTEAPLTLEGHRQQAWVFLFTDGAGLDQALASALERSALQQLLRSLSQWPRLQFVDTAKGHYGLAGRLRTYGIDCIAPREVASRLAGVANPDSTAAPADPRLSGNLAAWAAGLCLAPDGADLDTAIALLDAMKLEIPHWQYDALESDAASEGLIWPARRRAELLNWLTFSETFEIGKAQTGTTTLQRALDFWKKRYHLEISQRKQAENNKLSDWIDTPASARIRLELAFLDLWDRPERAEETLSRLEKVFETEISERLGFYGPSNFPRRAGGNDRIHLPWPSDVIDPARLSRLLELDFAKAWQPTFKTPRVSGGFGFAQGLGWGMFAIGAMQAIALYSAPPRIVEDDPVFQKPAFRAGIIEDLIVPENPIWKPKPGANLIIGTAKHLQQFTADSSQSFELRWQNRWLPHENPEPLGLNQVYYAGALPQPIRACASGWPRRSLVVIEAEPENQAARKLAAALLDKGSADKVLIGRDWAENLDEFIEIPLQATEPDQLILIVAEKTDTDVTRQFQGALGWMITPTGPLKKLERALSFPGVKPAGKVWEGVAGVQLGLPTPIKLRGGPDIKLPTADSPLSFVEVCGGTFSMGSESGNDDEKPVHPVTLDSFWISETEVTNAQYRQYKSDWPESDGQPATGIRWSDAKGFCERYRYRLPTEAEWEYGARGGSLTAWSFGDDEPALGDYAWFRGNTGYGIHPVKTRKPNPLGIYDMHGNVWEWVGDCYDENFYQQQSKEKLSLNPENQSTGCTVRGLRGGSAWRAPRLLRSANRVRSQPENRDEYVGFRCARSPAASD